MKIRTLIQTSMTLMILTACGPNGQIASVSNPTGSQSSTSQTSNSQTATQTDTQSSSQTSTQTSASLNGSVSGQMQSDMTAMHEEEAIYADAAAVADSSNSFATQALGASVSLNTRLRLSNGPRPVTKPAAPAKDLRTAAKAKLVVAAANRTQLKTHLITAGAISINGDGTITLDPKAFALTVNQRLQAEKAKFQDQLLRIEARLALKHQVGGDLLKRLYHHDFAVRTSDKTSVTNDDGSTTETVKISFENSKLGIKREVVLSKTSKDGKLVKVDFQLTESNPIFDRSLTRIATYNGDGTKNVLIDAKTTWKDGRSSERHEERLVNADGTVTGTGTITRTARDGSTKTYTISLNIAADGGMTTGASDPASQTEVTLDEQASGEATVTTDVNGQENATNVDIAADATAAASTGDSSAT